MHRTPINPWPWSTPLGFDQAELLDGARRQLLCSGQDAVDADGRPQHPGDMAAQIEASLDNLETVLGAAGMGLADVVRLTVYTTDLDAYFRHFPRVNARFGPDNRYATSLLGVSQLPAQLLVMFEATAAD